jgi:arabinose-5-phosphate isomerase
MGDALAVALLQARGFTEEDFARSHPGGSLGRRLLLHMRDLMHTGDQIPDVRPDTPLGEGLLEMTRKGLGLTTVIDDDGIIQGVFTDGDLRRALDSGLDLHKTAMRDVMTPHGKTVSPDILAAEAVRLMETHKITSLLATDESDRLVGVLHIHDLLRAGVM